MDKDKSEMKVEKVAERQVGWQFTTPHFSSLKYTEIITEDAEYEVIEPLKIENKK